MKKIKVGPKVSSVHTKKKKKSTDLEFKVQRTSKVEAEPVDDKESRMKMKKMTKQLALLGNGEIKPKDVQKTLTENFGQAAPKIIDMLEMNDNDGAMMLLQKRLLQSSISMLTYAERLMTNTEGAKGTYQYATLVSQIREIMADIQAQRDRSFIANSIIDQSLRPVFIDMAEMIMNKHQTFRKEMIEDKIIRDNKELPFNTGLRDLAKSMAEEMQGKYKDLSFKIMEQLTS
jgi:hypothetical protein